jgi:hypothetical protein
MEVKCAAKFNTSMVWCTGEYTDGTTGPHGLVLQGCNTRPVCPQVAPASKSMEALWTLVIGLAPLVVHWWCLS